AALRGALDDPSPRVRLAAAGALGRFREPAAAEALLERVAKEKCPLPRAHALRSLGRTREKSGVPALVAAAAERGTWNDVVPRFALEGLAEIRDRAHEPVFLAELARTRPDLVRAAAARGLAEIGVGAEDKARFREPLEKLLDEGFHVARAAIVALRALGDPRAGTALRRFAERRFADGRLKRAARVAARTLAAGVSAPEQVQALRDRLDRAEDEGRRLRDRLEAVEDKLKARAASPPDRRARGKGGRGGTDRPKRRRRPPRR
ncbi:MAG TPA: HEAT repeat domain-containing protein, partial [Planctomycetota bacterium]|nr:HEAT repeat domain-containing protein [Planctomycetota bacterium]